VSPGEDTWLIDSGASKNMTGQIDILSFLTENNFPEKVTLGYDYQYPIKGVGESNYKLDSGTPMKMKDVLYVPGLTKNLLYISALAKKGFRVAFIDGEVFMWPKGKTMEEAIVIGKEEGGLYKLKGYSEAALTHSIENPCELWHRRLDHINYKALPYVSKAVIDLSKFKVDHEGVCNGCAQGMTIKNPFPKRDSKARVIELIHLDVCGPMPSTSISGYGYYVSFIDDYSHKTWVYFLKSKDEVFVKFKEFKALIENISERKINILRSNNGGEYTSKEFVNFCKNVGIKRELTTPYNPQQNGVAERKNITIMEALKTIIHDQDLPMHLWVEVITMYVDNRLSHSALGFKTPKEMLSGKKLKVSHLKIFGCPYLYTFRKRREPS
jgi:transposase InsO family protein